MPRPSRRTSARDRTLSTSPWPAAFATRHRRHRTSSWTTFLALVALVAFAPIATVVADGGALDVGQAPIAVSAPNDLTGGSPGPDPATLGGSADVPASSVSPATHSGLAVYRVLGNDMWPLQGVGQIRQNSVFAATHEAKPPIDVPVYWIINRIVNATERALLVSELKQAGVRADKILHADPPVSRAKCLLVTDREAHESKVSEKRLLVFAQAQNAVRNAAVEHAAANGYAWAAPLDGNQFLPFDFYEKIRTAAFEADANGAIAVLIPMLRLIEKQTPERYNPSTDLLRVAEHHIGDDGAFAVSEPQLMLRAARARERWYVFDARAAYGAGNKAALLRALCPPDAKTHAQDAPPVRTTPDAMCCELVHMKLEQQRDSYYYGGEFNLKKFVVSNAKRGFKSKKETANQTRSLVLRAAENVFERCGGTVRLFNYPPEDGNVTQSKIATSVRARAAARDKASVIFAEFLRSYLKHAGDDEASPETCAALDVAAVSLTASDPDRTTPEQADAITREVERIKRGGTREEIDAEAATASATRSFAADVSEGNRFTSAAETNETRKKIVRSVEDVPMRMKKTGVVRAEDDPDESFVSPREGFAGGDGERKKVTSRAVFFLAACFLFLAARRLRLKRSAFARKDFVVDTARRCTRPRAS